jgi:hypothetical protein
MGKRATKKCDICHKNYTPTYGRQRTCSRQCGVELRRTITKTQLRKLMVATQTELLVAQCGQCGSLFLTVHVLQKICSRECRRNRTSAFVLAGYHDGRYRDRMLAAAHTRRARLAVAESDGTISLAVVAQRDGWVCGICRQAVPRTTSKLSRELMASLDHIVPIARGGSHTYDNVQLSHYRCNLSKGSRLPPP